MKSGSDKVLSTERITLIEDDKIINDDDEIANIMNTFFSNIVISLSVPKYHDCEGISGDISDPILKVIVRYRNHLSIKAIKRAYNLNDLVADLRKLIIWITQKHVKNQI